MRTFEFKGGTLALNFVDTVAYRQGPCVDLLGEPADLATWATLAGYEIGGAPSVAALEGARKLREAIWRSLGAAMEGRGPEKGDAEIINAAARQTPFRPQFTDDGMTHTAEKPLDALLSGVAADAILRLQPEARARLRRCPGCQMYFFDTSPPGKRVWCSSAVGCGNQFKKKRHYARTSKTKNNIKSHGDRA